MKKITLSTGLSLIYTLLIFIVTPVTFVNGNPTSDESNKQTLKSSITADWNIYRDEKYGFELKYPKNWSVRSFTEPTGGERWLEEIILKDHQPAKRRITLNENRDIYIKIYRLYSEENDKNILLKKLSFTDEFHQGYSFSDSCLTSNVTTNVLKGIYFIEISVNDSNRDCFYSGAYFFSGEKDGYIFNIIPVPKGGINYAGYNGKKMVTYMFPEFYDILSTFKFTK